MFGLAKYWAFFSSHFQKTLEQTCWDLPKTNMNPINDGPWKTSDHFLKQLWGFGVDVSSRSCFRECFFRCLNIAVWKPSTQIGDHYQQRFQCNWCRVSGLGFVSFLAVFWTPFCWKKTIPKTLLINLTCFQQLNKGHHVSSWLFWRVNLLD